MPVGSGRFGGGPRGRWGALFDVSWTSSAGRVRHTAPLVAGSGTRS